MSSSSSKKYQSSNSRDCQSSSSSSTYQDHQTMKNKYQVVERDNKHEMQHAKPTAVVFPEKRNDVKPMFPKPSNR